MTSPRHIRVAVRQREEARAERVQRRWDELRSEASRLAEVLRDEYGAERVILFGSLAWGEPNEHADIDLAVAGVAADRYFHALGRLLEESSDSVDLVRIEDAPASLLKRLDADGVGL